MDLFTLGLLQKNLSGNKSDIKSKNGESSYTIRDAVDYPVLGLNLYGKSVQDGVPTPDNPVDIVSVGDSGSINIKSCGKNLLNYDAWKTNNGITRGTAIFENNGITITATGNDAYTAYGYNAISDLARVFVIKGETITLSWEESTNTPGKVFIFPNGKDAGNVRCNNNTQKKLTYTVPSGVQFITYRFGVDSAGNTISYKNIMIERGSEATAYEPYHGATANITTALPLCGIPVDSGGNYTDNNGQQWVCDELIYNADGSGKIIKRTKKTTITSDITPEYDGVSTKDSNVHIFDYHYSQLGMTDYKFYNTDHITIEMNMGKMLTKFMARTDASVDSFKYLADGEFSTNTLNTDNVYDNYLEIGTSKASTVEEFKALINGCEIVYILATPQEIELTAAEMIVLRQLMTYSGTTNISNSDNADMDVKYCINQVMADYYPIFAGQGADVQPLVLFQGTDEGYSLADGFTGFSKYSQGVADMNINKTVDATTESQYGYRIGKPWSIDAKEANYTDSVIFSSNELVDLTNYNTICIDFYGHCDYSTSDMSDANDMAAYFRVDLPKTLPQSKVAYDWSGWDNMGMNYHKRGKYYFDVSHLTGKHDLCFGIFHGTYDIGYTNGIKIYKMTLI